MGSASTDRARAPRRPGCERGVGGAPYGRGVPTILDASQRAVLDLPEDASATVLGVAGAGKTTTVVELVADRFARPGWSGGDVLVLAGSRAAATRLRDRLAARVDVVTPGPLARTAASFAYALLGEQALALGVERPQLLSGSEQDGILASITLEQLERDAPAHGLVVRHAPLTRDDLQRARGGWLISSGRLASAITSIDGVPYPSSPLHDALCRVLEVHG